MQPQQQIETDSMKTFVYHYLWRVQRSQFASLFNPGGILQVYASTAPGQCHLQGTPVAVVSGITGYPDDTFTHPTLERILRPKRERQFRDRRPLRQPLAVGERGPDTGAVLDDLRPHLAARPRLICAGAGDPRRSPLQVSNTGDPARCILLREYMT